MKLQDYFFCTKKTKITTLFNNFFSLPCQSSMQVHESTMHVDFIKNILICVPKMNEGFTGLEQHEGE